jgi:hypothetical protein
MVTGLVLGLLVLTGRTATVSSDSVYGVVRDAVSGGALAGVSVDVDAGPHALTDARGGYAVAAPDGGTHPVRFTRRGFEPFVVQVSVHAGRSQRLDIGLTPLPVTLPPISVATLAYGAPAVEDVPDELGLRRFGPGGLRDDPLVPPDDALLAAAGGAVESQAGSARPLRVHGGSADQNLVLVDGLPVYGLTHQGGSAGLLDPDLIGQVERHADVPSAAYGGRLSSVLAVDLRAPDSGAVHMTGAWDALAVRQAVSAPIGSAAAVQAGLRRSYGGLFTSDFHDAERNGFGDGIVRLSLRGARDRLSAYAMGGMDNLAFQGSVTAANEFDWSYRTVGIAWRHELGPAHALTVRAWEARADARLAWLADTAGERVTSSLREPGVSVELSSSRGAPAAVGLALSRPSTSYALDRAMPVRLAAAPVLGSAFAQRDWRAGRFAGVAGLRAEVPDGRRVLLEPRLSTRLDLAPGVAALVGYARIHQFVQSLRNEASPLDHAVSAELPLAIGAGGLEPARVDQLAAALAVRLDPRTHAELHGYVRSFRGVTAVPLATAGPFARGAVPSGQARARGIEAELRRAGASIDAHVQLGLASASRAATGESYVPAGLRSRWLLAGVGWHLDGRTVARLAGAVASGAPAALVAGDVIWDSADLLSVGDEIVGSPEALDGSLHRGRPSGYWRLDAGIVRDWEVRALGRAGVLTTSATLSNLLDTRNPLAWTVSPSGARRPINLPLRNLELRLGWRF